MVSIGDQKISGDDFYKVFGLRLDENKIDSRVNRQPFHRRTLPETFGDCRLIVFQPFYFGKMQVKAGPLGQ